MTQTIELSPEQRRVVDHRGTPILVVACAGSGKTETMAQRVAALVAEGVPPSGIVAFTFTEKAATELKLRIVDRVTKRLGVEVRGRLTSMFVGTIHAYCLRLLQDHVPGYGNFDILDPHRQAGFLSRIWKDIDYTSPNTTSKWASIEEFASTCDVVGDELIDPALIPDDPFGAPYRRFRAIAERFHVLTFSMVISEAVAALKRPDVAERVCVPLRHLIVDEYQDVNPSQEALVQALTSRNAELCAVGDDDQSIYQWRGSEVRNILEFPRRYRGATSHPLNVNRRCRREILEAAARFVGSVQPRLAKAMTASREGDPHAVVPWKADTEEDEAAAIAAAIVRHGESGRRYRDIAVLFRSVRSSAGPLVDALVAKGIPFSCAGRTGLFSHPEADLLGRTYQWLVDFDWRKPGWGETPAPVTKDDLLRDYESVFGADRKRLKPFLDAWKNEIRPEEERRARQRPADLIGTYYKLLSEIGVTDLDPDDPADAARLGTLARFSVVLEDFEHVTRRGRYAEDAGDAAAAAFKGGMDRGEPYMKRLAGYLQHYAADAYEGFKGEEAPDLDAVSILTVHGAKGLEWPVVFLPGLTSRRFPSSMSGRGRNWVLPESLFSAPARARYEGGDVDERRLFYVAMTRARDQLYISYPGRRKQTFKPSPYLEELAGKSVPNLATLPICAVPADAAKSEAAPLAVSFSELGDFEDCGYRYRLRSSFGFGVPIAAELGFGRAVHHVLRTIADDARATGRIPDALDLPGILDRHLYLPFANKTSHELMRKAAESLVRRYLTDHREDLRRVWATERSFELHLDEAVVSGRSDVILGGEDGVADRLAIVDYKASAARERDDLHQFQLKVYAAAGRAEGLTVAAAYVHDLRTGARTSVEVSPESSEAALGRVRDLAQAMRARRLEARPATDKCSKCDHRPVCRHAPTDPWSD